MEESGFPYVEVITVLYFINVHKLNNIIKNFTYAERVV